MNTETQPTTDALTESANALLDTMTHTLPDDGVHADGFKPVDTLEEMDAIIARVEGNLAADRNASGYTGRPAPGYYVRPISLGRDVHFLSHTGVLYVAKVVDVTAAPEAPYEARVSLAVFIPGDAHLMPVTNVAEGTEPGTWRWPTLI